MQLEGVSEEEFERIRKMLKEEDIDGLVEYLVKGRQKEQKKCTCQTPAYYYSPEGARGHCTCGAPT